MRVEVLLPKIGFTTDEGTLAAWHVADGATVTAGQPLFAIETDKAINDIEAPASGTLRILKAMGETYEVGTILAHIDSTTTSGSV